MRKAGTRIILFALMLLGALGLMVSPAAAATATQTVQCNNLTVNGQGCYGLPMPTTLSAGSSTTYTGTIVATSASSVCSSFTLSGSGTVNVSFAGGVPQSFSAPGTYTYCSSASTVLLYARYGRELLQFTVTSGSVTLNAASITVTSSSIT